jgi:PTS system beta-glucosides-specific IIC component
VDGTIATVYRTKHAYALTTEAGAEILIHIGIDTVKLKGENFTSHVEDGMKVKKGDLIAEFDLGKIKQLGYDVTTSIVITNSNDYLDVLPLTKKHVVHGEESLSLMI